MGLCGSSLSEEEKASRALTQQAQADHAAEKRKIKLLLLGVCQLWCPEPACGSGRVRFLCERVGSLPLSLFTPLHCAALARPHHPSLLPLQVLASLASPPFSSR
jgi:hypothetical protein